MLFLTCSRKNYGCFTQNKEPIYLFLRVISICKWRSDLQSMLGVGQVKDPNLLYIYNSDETSIGSYKFINITTFQARNHDALNLEGIINYV